MPLHTTGLDLQGQNMGPLRFGYDLMIGNGLRSGEGTTFTVRLPL